MGTAADGDDATAAREGDKDEKEVKGLPAAFSLAPRELLAVGLPQTILAALVAWSVTLAPAAFSRSAPRGAGVLAILALIAGTAGPLFMTTRPRLSRHIGISVFLALAVITWLLASPAIQPARTDPLRAAIGAVAWGVFALSWNERWTSKSSEELDPHAPSLPARATLPRLSVPIAAIGVLAGLTYAAMAWRVRDVDRALMAHAVAISCAVAVITAAATVATGRGKRPIGGSRRVTSQALRALILLVALAIVGAVILSVR